MRRTSHIRSAPLEAGRAFPDHAHRREDRLMIASDSRKSRTYLFASLEQSEEPVKRSLHGFIDQETATIAKGWEGLPKFTMTVQTERSCILSTSRHQNHTLRICHDSLTSILTTIVSHQLQEIIDDERFDTENLVEPTGATTRKL